jgi:adenine C2-methylase RlmN of 23S rRNA A2503 and tRNA A37
MSMKLEARMIYYDQVHMDIYRTQDNHLVETVVFAGTNYLKTLLSLTNQIGCPVGCDFCFGNQFKYARNITADEFFQQVKGALETNPLVPWYTPDRAVKVGFQRAGEALLNKNFFDGFKQIADSYHPSFQLTTIMPNSDVAQEQLEKLTGYLSTYDNSFQINVSMHTSDESKRKQMMGNFQHLMKFQEIEEFGKKWAKNNQQRRIDLSFVLMDDNEVDFKAIREIFDPNIFAVRFAFYLPSSEETKQRHTPSGQARMNAKIGEAKKEGFAVIPSYPGYVEEIWDTRPFSTYKMLREK